MILRLTNLVENKEALGRCLRLFFLSLCLLLTFSCTSAKREFLLAERMDDDFLPYNIELEDLYPGISYGTFTNSHLPLIYHLVRIDLSLPGLELCCYPEGDSFAKDQFFKGLFTSDFARKNNCLVAINASPFDTPLNLSFEKLFSRRKNAGLLIAGQRLLASPREKYAALLFFREDSSSGQGGWSASVLESQSLGASGDAVYGFGGFFSVLKDGVVRSFSHTSYDSRCGAGVDGSGRILYILVAEGEKKSLSGGLSYEECGKIFAFLGCDDALEFDGGSSTSLCIGGRSVLSFKNLVRQGSQLGFCIRD